ncbi:hypothetical protein KCM76_00345 [Zooshikella marina]|uniref:Uncharacterized protein n=1 Tax=Zooshikella ganghwensis TaxID=202772 RepID=A0A4P9VSA2_9GAMM|nr:hypothetical protein [Zooshikella ganghwensis]MBU2704414.1 hypothetical protein [Zooshikella ganghwensis]RDH44880.1 hypothetical protein B9G39_16370 [Zooshikella ganghwensis]
MTHIWFYLLGFIFVGILLTYIFAAAARQYVSKQVSDNTPPPGKMEQAFTKGRQAGDRRKNSQPVFFPFRDSSGIVVTGERRSQTDRRTPF